MYRKALVELLKWKTSPDRKPLVLRGARQVGKTWLLKHFGKLNYANVVYLNFEEIADIGQLFRDDLDPRRIIAAIERNTSTKINPKNTLIIFDEIQTVPRALTSLKYFYENAPEYHIAVAGSLLGIALHEGTSFPVGKVDFLDVLPMDFSEFLSAIGHQGLAKIITGETPPSESILSHNTLINHLKTYMVVGGMPEAVDAYRTSSDFATVRAIQQKIIDAYELDFSKHAPNTDVPKIRQIYNAVPAFLSRENKKFIFKALRDSARAREYEAALLWIEDTGLASKVTRVSTVGIPLAAYASDNIFKLFMSDIGLLGTKMQLDPSTILDTDDLFREYKGAFAEQLVFQEMRAAQIPMFYYSNDDSKGEIDFLVQAKSDIIPIEVKSGSNLNSVSLNNFIAKWGLKRAIKLSMLPYKENETITNVPLYLASQVAAISHPAK